MSIRITAKQKLRTKRVREKGLGQELACDLPRSTLLESGIRQTTAAGGTKARGFVPGRSGSSIRHSIFKLSKKVDFHSVSAASTPVHPK